MYMINLSNAECSKWLHIRQHIVCNQSFITRLCRIVFFSVSLVPKVAYKSYILELLETSGVCTALLMRRFSFYQSLILYGKKSASALTKCIVTSIPMSFFSTKLCMLARVFYINENVRSLSEQTTSLKLMSKERVFCSLVIEYTSYRHIGILW